MSLLAELLSKVKYQGDKADVPPGLKRVVSDSAERKDAGRKFIIFAALALFAVAGGFGAVYLVEHYVKSPAVKKTEPKTEIPASSLESSDHRIPEHPPLKKRVFPGHLNQRIHEPSPSLPEREIVREDVPLPAPSPPPPAKDARAAEKESYLYTARTYESAGQYSQALAFYKKALETDAENYVIMNNVAAALIRLGNMEETEVYSERALSIRKDYVPSLVNLGIALISRGRQAEGEGYLKKALSIEPLNPYALLNMGLLCEKRGDNEGAYGYYFRLSETGDVRGGLGAARISEKQGNTNQAVRVYQDIISANGVDPKIKKAASERITELGR